jgi:hypothetical protein
LSSIKEFKYQVRPYQWVEFKNIPIEAGQKAETKVVSPDTPSAMSAAPGAGRE